MTATFRSASCNLVHPPCHGFEAPSFERLNKIRCASLGHTLHPFVCTHNASELLWAVTLRSAWHGCLLSRFVCCGDLSGISTPTPMSVGERRHHRWTKASTVPERLRFQVQFVYSSSTPTPQGGPGKQARFYSCGRGSQGRWGQWPGVSAVPPGLSVPGSTWSDA